MSFWRNKVIDFALDHETRRRMDEQRAWIGREPANPRPHYQLAQFFRIAGKPDASAGAFCGSTCEVGRRKRPPHNIKCCGEMSCSGATA